MPPKRCARSIAAAHTATHPTSSSQLSAKFEFRSMVDDAWYSSWLQLEGETLCVIHITDEERFPASQFKTTAAIEEFSDRFRSESVPVEKEKCAEVVEGSVVCGINEYQKSKFYDAVVDSVFRSHREGKCSCVFVLLWQHGPLKKRKTMTSIDNICFIQSRDSQVDSILDSFLNLARSKVEERNALVGNLPRSLRQENESKGCYIASPSTEVAPCTGGNPESSGYEPVNFQSSACRIEEMTPTTVGKHKFGKKHKSRTAQDMYLGSSIKRKTDPPGCYFFFRVSNLERDITPVCIMDFIFQQTNISSVAIVFPALLSEPFSTGAIFVETKEKFGKLSEFLLNAGHLIISSRGRPWVLNAKWNGSIEGRMPKYESERAKGGEEHFGELKLATSGEQEYVMGVELQKLYMEFMEYKEGLHDSLETEMKKIARRFPSEGTT